MKRKQHDIGQIYAQYLNAENEKNRLERYDGKEYYYHASGSGKCSRQLYYQSVEKTKPTNPADAKSMRVMRLGTIVHEDIQKSLVLYNINNNINNNINSDNIPSELTLSVGSKGFVIEGEVIIKELNVRGFFDLLQIQNEGERGSGFFLYDIKTAADYSFRKVFNTDKPYTMKHQELQLSTYGYGVKEKYGRLDGMYLLYYNKNTSVIKYKQVPLSMLNSAYMFWANINKQHSVGLPNFEDGVSPVMKWECDYCEFKDHCSPPTGYGKYSDRNTLKKGELINE